MSEITRVALDVCLHSLAEIVKGAVTAVTSRKDIKVYLVGITEAIQKESTGYTYPKDQIEIVEAPEVIGDESRR